MLSIPVHRVLLDEKVAQAICLCLGYIIMLNRNIAAIRINPESRVGFCPHYC
jgi:hypothetical protein